MLQRINQRAFFLFALATGAMLILASAISRVQLVPGLPGSAEFPADSPLAQLVPFSLAGNEVIFYLFLVCLILAIIALALVPEGRIRLIRYILVVAVLYLLSQLLAPGASVHQAQFAETETAKPPDSNEFLPLITPQAEIGSGFETPAWLVTATGIGLALLLVGGGAAIIWFFIWPRFGAATFEEISIRAQAAIEALEAGGNFEDIILSCYARMSQVLFEQRGVSRESGMTPHEFERALINLGFPSEPIRTLTHLFEEVRYGNIQPGADGRRMAVSSLNAIISYCKSLEPV